MTYIQIVFNLSVSHEIAIYFFYEEPPITHRIKKIFARIYSTKLANKYIC